MKKAALVTAIVLGFSFNTALVKAEASTEENVGFFSGAIAGAAVGGPIGFFVGGVAGALTGDQVHKANQLDETKIKLSEQLDENQEIQQQLVELQQGAQQIKSSLTSSAEWLTQGLTLNLMFTTNSAELSQNDHLMISRISKIVTQHPELKVLLDGYADPRGSDESNMTLSKARAKAVEQAFAAQGVSSLRLVITAHGESKATTQSGNLDDYAMDRRVSVNFLTAEEVTVAQN